MGRKAPHRHEIIGREFSVRLTVRSDPATNEMTRQWLRRHVGTGDYASKRQIMWTERRCHYVYFRAVHAALMFVAGCPHIELVGEA